MKNVTNWKDNVKNFHDEWVALDLNNIQLELLKQCCDQLQLMELCKDDIAENGIQYLTNIGGMKKNPAVGTLKESSDSFQKLLRLLTESMAGE